MTGLKQLTLNRSPFVSWKNRTHLKPASHLEKIKTITSHDSEGFQALCHTSIIHSAFRLSEQKIEIELQ